MNKELSKLTKDEKSLLLFFECAAVDYGGKLNVAHMNEDDFKIAEQWTAIFFIVLHCLNYLFGQKDNPIIDDEVIRVIKKSWNKY